MPVRTLMFGKWMMDCISPHPPPPKKPPPAGNPKNSEEKTSSTFKIPLTHFAVDVCCCPKHQATTKNNGFREKEIPKEHFLDWPSFSIKWPMTDVSSGDLSWVNYMESVGPVIFQGKKVWGVFGWMMKKDRGINRNGRLFCVLVIFFELSDKMHQKFQYLLSTEHWPTWEPEKKTPREGKKHRLKHPVFWGDSFWGVRDPAVIQRLADSLR